MFRFEWVDSPSEVFPGGARAYIEAIQDAVYRIMVEEAPNIQAFMRANAPWKDDCMPGREYLKAAAFRDETSVGIMAYYDLELYRQNCPEPAYDWGIAHETFTFSRAGIISIILPRRSPTVLGEEAERVFERVRALFQ